MANNKITDVDPALILRTVSELDTCIAQMNGCIKNIMTCVEELQKTWSGEAAQVFMSQYEADKAAFGVHTVEYQKLNDALRQVAQAYQTSDHGVLSELSKIRI